MSVTRRRRAVVFDLDGTLLDSMSRVLHEIAEAIAPFHPLTPAEIFAKLGGPPSRFMAALLPDPNHVPLALARLNSLGNENWRRVTPYDGIAAQLRQLQAGGLRLAVWTGRDRDSGAWLLREHALEAFFDTVVYGDDLPTHKPDPEGLREIIRRLGVTEAETLYVGDADVDVLGGEACGIDTLLIDHGRAIPAEIGAKSWRRVATPRAACELLLQGL